MSLFKNTEKETKKCRPIFKNKKKNNPIKNMVLKHLIALLKEALTLSV